MKEAIRLLPQLSIGDFVLILFILDVVKKKGLRMVASIN